MVALLKDFVKFLYAYIPQIVLKKCCEIYIRGILISYQGYEIILMQKFWNTEIFRFIILVFAAVWPCKGECNYCNLILLANAIYTSIPFS